jgi:hypothetical protein
MRTRSAFFALCFSSALLAQETVPYATSFEGAEGNLNENFPSGWTAQDLNTPGFGNQGWQIIKNTDSQQNAHTDSTAVHMFSNANEANDDWLFSPGFQVQAGSTYAISFWYSRAALFASTEKLAVHVGTVAVNTAMGPALWQNTNITNGAYQQAVVTWTAPATDVFRFGFHYFSDAFEFILLMDDFAITGADAINEAAAPALDAWMVGDDLVIVPPTEAIGSRAQVIDMQGRRVATMRMGSSREVRSLAQCAEGVYTVVIDSPRGRLSRRITLVR